MEKPTYVSNLFRIIASLSVAACFAAQATEALAAPCKKASGTIGYYEAKNYFGIAGCDGVEARPSELLELCRIFLGATSRAHVTYGTVLTGDFHSPEDNTQCEFVPGTAQKRVVPADHSLNAVKVDCSCKQCADGIDNDKDGAKDFPQDKSCSAETDASELFPRMQCNDGIDNDKDGAVDLADKSCAKNKQNNDEAAPKTKCQDGLDNDEDGRIDLVDPDCKNNSQIDTEGPPRIEITEQPQDQTVTNQNVQLRRVLNTVTFSAFAVIRGLPPGALASDLEIQWQQRQGLSNCPPGGCNVRPASVESKSLCPDEWCDIEGADSHELTIPISPVDAPREGQTPVLRNYRARFSYSGLPSVTSRTASLTIHPPAPLPPERGRLVCSRPLDVVLDAKLNALFKTKCSVHPQVTQIKYNWEMMNPQSTSGKWVRVFPTDKFMPGEYKSPLRGEFEVPLDLSLTPEFVAGLTSTTYYRALVSVADRDGSSSQNFVPVVTESARLLLPNQSSAKISFKKNLQDQPVSERPSFTVQASINVRPPGTFSSDWLRFDWQVRDISSAESTWVSISTTNSPWGMRSSKNITPGADVDPLWEGRLEIETYFLPGVVKGDATTIAPALARFAETHAFRVIVRAPATDAAEETSREARFVLPSGPAASPPLLEVGTPNITTCFKTKMESYTDINVDAVARINRSASSAPVAFKLEYREGETGKWAEVPQNLLSTWRVVSHEWNKQSEQAGTLWGADVQIKTETMKAEDAEKWVGYQYRVVATTSLEGVAPVPSVEQVPVLRFGAFCQGGRHVFN